MKLIVKKGRTSLLVRVFIADSSSTVGAGLTGLTNLSSSLVCYRARDDDGNAGATQISLSAGTRGTWSSGGFIQKDSTNMPGWYELGIPDNAIATGSESVDIELKGATNMAPCNLEIQLVAYDPQVATNLGLSALPTAAAAAAGGLLISGSNSGTTTLAALTVTGATTLTGNVALADGLTIAAPSTTNRAGLDITGNGTGAGIISTGGATGDGVKAVGGASGHGLTASGTGTTKHGINAVGGGTTSAGIAATGGATSGDGVLISAGGSGHGLTATGIGTTKHGINATGGATTSAGIAATGGATSGDAILAVAPTSGHGLVATGAGTTKHGISATGGATTSHGISAAGGGAGDGIKAVGGGTGNGFELVGGGTSGDGLKVTTTSGHGFNIAATGASKHGITATGGNSGTSDGIVAAAGTGGVDLRAAITGNITGNLSGSAGSVTGAVGSVTGAVGSVTGAVGSVTARVTANADQWAGGTIPSPAVTGVPKVDLTYILGTILSETAGQIAAAFKKFFNIATPASTMDALTLVATATTVTNRVTANVDQIDGASWGTHAAGMAPADLRDIAGAAVSTSTAQLGVNVVNNAGSAITAASGVQEVKVASIAANAITATAIADAAIDAATFAAGAIDAAAIATDAIGSAEFSQAAADKVWSTAARLLTAGTNIVLAKGTGVTGFTDLTAAAAADAVWDEAIADHSGVAGSTAAVLGGVKTKTDQLTFTVSNQVDSNVQYVNDVQVNGVGTAGNPWGP